MENNKQSQTNLNDNVINTDLWNALSFEGKEYCEVKNGNELLLKATAYSPEKSIATVNAANVSTICHALGEKFKEVSEKWNEMDQEMSTDIDILKKLNKIERFKSYLLHTNAIGDVASIHEKVNVHEIKIKHQLTDNINLRAEIVEKIKTLCKEATDFKQALEQYKGLIEDWKKAPLVPKEQNDILWAQIEDARNGFYERKREFQSEMEAQFLQNLDAKLEICEKAEALQQSEEWKSTTEVFKTLMEDWKTIGRVASIEKNDELWNRFTNARNAFYERKKLNFESIQSEQEHNYNLKLALVETAESLQNSTAWKEVAQQFNEIMEQWRTIGKVPFEKAEILWNRLQTAKDVFYNAKRQHAELFKLNLEDNLAQKKALLERMEALKDCSDWKTNTEEINELLAEWKKVGPIPKEFGDSLWESFIAARQHFFKRKDEDREKRKQRFTEQVTSRLTQSRAFLQKLESQQYDDELLINEYKMHLETAATDAALDDKDVEIQKNLKNLLYQAQERISNRIFKIEEVKQQIADLEQKLDSNIQTAVPKSNDDSNAVVYFE